MFSKRFSARLMDFFADRAGALAVTFAVVAPALLVVGGVATDYAFMVRYRTEMQTVADAAAIAGARELTLAQTPVSQVDAVVSNFVAVNAKHDASQLTTKTKVDSNDSSVEVDLSRKWAPLFLHFVSSSVTPITVRATARTIGADKVCVIGLDQSASDTVSLTDKATMTANNCAVYSDSVSSTSLTVGSGAMLKSDFTCTVGGYTGSSSSFDPQPVTDCPKVADPLADRSPPSFGACDYYKLTISAQTTTLNPGVYCAGIYVTKGSDVTLNPGVYVIKKGSLKVDGSSKLEGDHVGFYLTSNATFAFTKDSVIDLSAPRQGALAGLLFFEDRSNNPGLNSSITSDNARYLIGTIYLPQGYLKIDSSTAVADQSAYTAIVVRTLKLKAGPNLVLNSNYDQSDVPVPSGLKDLAGGRIVLTN